MLAFCLYVLAIQPYYFFDLSSFHLLLTYSSSAAAIQLGNKT
jgi:hypothetical protein